MHATEGHLKRRGMADQHDASTIDYGYANGSESLCELTSDPAERRNLVATIEPSRLEHLRHMLAAYLEQ